MRRSYAGGATKGSPTSPITTIATSFPVTPMAGWPDGTGGPFAVKVGRGTSNEEKMLCSSFNGSTIAIIQRGYDGTTANNHSTTEVVELITTGIDADEANAHVNAVISVHGLNAGDQVVGRATPSTLLGKIMDGAANTFTNIPRIASPQLQADIAATVASIATLTTGLAAAATTAAMNVAIAAEAATRAAADATFLTIANAGTTYLPLSGGSLTGQVTQGSQPTTNQHLVNKLYVDGQDATTLSLARAAAIVDLFAGGGKVLFLSQVKTVNSSGWVDFDMTGLPLTSVLGMVLMNGDGTSVGTGDQTFAKITGAATGKQRVLCRVGGANVGNGVNVRLDAIIVGTA
jgi:hypothetical protein